MSLAQKLEYIAKTKLDKVFQKLPHTLMVKRITNTPDGGGGQIPSESYVQNFGSDLQLPCFYEPKTERIQKVLSNGQIQHFAAYEVMVQKFLDGEQVDIQPSDRLEISDFGTETAITHHIEAIKNESGIHLTIITRTE